MALSVNISNYERGQIVQNAQAAYFKTAGNTDPDVNIRKIITAKIYTDRLAYIEEQVPKECYKHLAYVDKHSLGYKLSCLSLDEQYAIKNAAHSGSTLIASNRLLEEIPFEDLNIPSKFVFDNKVMFPFEEHGKNIDINISDSVKAKITEHNEKIDALLGDMDESLKNLTQSINECKTTKSYETKLPNLTSLYPPTVLRKIERKNAVEEVEMSEHDKLLQKASVVIATSKLMEE